MRDVFKLIPGPLQRQILYKLGYAVLLALVSIGFLVSSVEPLSVLACALIAVFFAADAFLLFRRTVTGEYVVIRGKCESVVLTAVGKRIKTVVLHTDEYGTLKVRLRQRHITIRPGAEVALYIAANTPVYETDNTYLLYSYLAVEGN